MTTEQKRLFWQSHIQDWKKSRQTQKAYCQKHGLSLAQFGYWRTRFNQNERTPSKLVPVQMPHPNPGVTLYLPGGVRMELPVSALADVLPVVYRAVRDAS